MEAPPCNYRSGGVGEDPEGGLLSTLGSKVGKRDKRNVKEGATK